MDPNEFLQPIPGDNPAGADLRYEPVYDQIKVARTEEDDVPQGDWQRERKVADWPLVIKLASDVLKNKSKDLQIAAWFTEALTRREGFAGLQSGITLLHGLVENFWDGLYPELEDGDAEFRASPLEWIGGGYLDAAVKFVPLNKAGHDLFSYRESRKVGYEDDADGDSEKLMARNEALAEGKLAPEDFDSSFNETPKPFYKKLIADLDGAIEKLKTLEALTDEKFGDVAPSFTRLRESLKDVRVTAAQLLKQKLEQDPDPVSMEPAPTIEVGGEPESGEGGGLPLLPRSPEDAASRVASAAKYLRSVAPTNPAPYLMLRGLRWGELRANGSVIDPMILSAPPTAVRTQLKTYLLKGDWAHLLETGEDVMATPYGRGWLDLQRYILTACAELGGDYDHVSTAVRGALHSLLRDLPDLLDMTLMDDSPTANRETRGWLAENGLLEGGEELDTPAAPARDRSRSRRDPYDLAMERVRAGEPDRAIDLLMREASQEKSERATFMRRLQAAGIMVDAGLDAVALPILQEMAEQVDRHELESWESGEAVANALGLLYRCMTRLNEDDGTREALYLRVCRLDPIQAIRFTSPSSSATDEQGD